MSKPDVPYSRFDSEVVFDLAPDYIGGGDEPPGGAMEARIKALEEQAKDTRGTLESIQRQLARLDERMSHMPTTKDIYTIVFSVYGLSFTVMAAAFAAFALLR